MQRAALAIAARLAGRLRRGIEVSAVPAARPPPMTRAVTRHRRAGRR